uniref:Uncharacterized protein n=1 Tax=Oryza rufipogon TaxID=4529 RepID=A0A0E0PKZ5_ORYRU
MSVLTYVLDNIGSSCSRSHSLSEAETAENAKTLTGEFCKRQKQSNTSTSSYFLMSFTLSYHHEIGEKLSDIDGRLDYPLLNKELVLDVKRLWQDPAIQETYLRGSILQLPDCAQYFMENLDRLAEADYVPTKGLKFNIREEKLLFYHYYAVYITKIVPQDHDSDELWSAIRGDDCVEYGYVHPECRRQ